MLLGSALARSTPPAGSRAVSPTFRALTKRRSGVQQVRFFFRVSSENPDKSYETSRSRTTARKQI